MIGTELDKIQKKLHDSGAIWPREELLRWWQDGYRQILSQSLAVRRFWIEDVPGRVTFARTQEWEDRYHSGTHWRFVHEAGGGYGVTSEWELEQLGGSLTNPTPDENYVWWDRLDTGTFYEVIFGQTISVVSKLHATGGVGGWILNGGNYVWIEGGVMKFGSTVITGAVAAPGGVALSVNNGVLVYTP